MSNFQRRLPDNGMCALKRLSSNPAGWWPDLLSSWAPSGSPGQLRLAVRNRYMNFYAKGQSIAKITFSQGGSLAAMRIHEKYVNGSSDGGQRYVRLTETEGRDADGCPVPWRGPEMLKRWVQESHCYTSEEKRCIETLVQHSPKVIDLEMGLPAFGNRKSPLRMDLVSLEETPEDIRLVFWEAKMIGNNALVSRTQEPAVLKQIEAYSCYLTDSVRKKQVEEAYRQCCEIICELHKLAKLVGMTLPLDPLIEAAAISKLVVEETPRLIVFKYGKKRDETAWQEHLKVLLRKVNVTIVDGSSIGVPLESIPRCE